MSSDIPVMTTYIRHPVAYLKGLAFEHTLYPDTDMRTIGDIDILVRERDLDSLIGRGFEFKTLPMPL